MITQNIHVRMDAYGIPPVIHAVEGDTWRYLDIYTDDAAINTSNTAVVAIHRPDDSYYTIEAMPEPLFYHLEMDQALTRPGKVECQLKVSSGDLVISTYTFHIVVEPSTTGLPTEQLGYDIYDLIDAAETITPNSGLTEDIKQALLTCFEHVAWTDEHGQDYVDALEAALYPPANLLSISAVYTQSGTVYETDTLDSLRDDLVVTAYYDDSSSEVVTTYTLSGTLVGGISTITVSYGGKTTTFNVTVTAPATLSSITAVYTQSGTVYATDSLDSLKTDLVVTAVYSDSTTQTVASTDYTLSGTLTEGTSTITVSYGGKTDTFTVTVSAPSLNYTYNWDFTQSLTDSVQGVTLTPSGATRDSSGLHFTATAQYVLLGTLGEAGNCFELDIASVDRKGTNHGRVFIIYQGGTANSGLIYRSTGKWALYSSDGSMWHDTELTSPTALDGKTVTIKLLKNASNSNKLWMYVYVDGELLVDGSMGNSTNKNLYIGSDNSQTLYDMTITGLRMYQEV